MRIELADECVWRELLQYEQMPFGQLVARAGECMTVKDVMCGPETVRVTTRVSHLPFLWNRVEVEITAAAKDESSWHRIPSVYYVRYPRARARLGSNLGCTADEIRRSSHRLCWLAGAVIILSLALWLLITQYVH